MIHQTMPTLSQTVERLPAGRTVNPRAEVWESECFDLEVERVGGGAPPQLAEKSEEFLGRGAGQGHGSVVFGVAEGEFHAGQQQTVQAEMFAEEAVLAAVAAQHVADDRVADVGEVASDLVGAAGSGLNPDQAVAGGGVWADRERNFRLFQAREFGPGLLQAA